MPSSANMIQIQSVPDIRMPLSSRELLEISMDISRDFMPQYPAPLSLTSQYPVFSAQELLSISQEINRDYALWQETQTSNLVLLPIDSSRLQVYWQLVPADLPSSNQNIKEQKLTIRVFNHSALIEKEPTDQQLSWFDLAINNTQGNQQLVLPEKNPAKKSDFVLNGRLGVNHKILPIEIAETAQTYSAALGVVNEDESFTALVHSNQINLLNPGLAAIQDCLPAVSDYISVNLFSSSSISNANLQINTENT